MSLALRIRNSHLQKGLLSIVVLIITFPRIEPDFTVGLDSPYMWGLNYLFISNYEFLKHLIFPIGILGFLKHPVVIGNNVLYALIFLSALKLLFIFLLFQVFQGERVLRQALNFILIVIAASVINVDFAIVGCTILLIYSFWQNRNYALFVFAMLIATLGLFIKSSIGVSSLGVIVVFIIYDFWRQRNLKQTLVLVGISAIVLLIVGLTLFQSIALFINAVWSILMLVLGYSSALALFPENNWLLLTLFLLAIFAIPIIYKDKESRFLYTIMLLPLFLMWKHSMLREEASHYSLLLEFTIIFWVTLILSAKDNKATYYILAISSVVFLFGNLKSIDSSATFGVKINGISTFSEEVLSYNNYVKNYRKISEENIQQSRLSDKMMASIGNSTIDIYPWDFSYVPANKLNWKPRTTLQSGAYSKWLDNESAKNFQNQAGPELILIHSVDDWNYGKFGSIDGRYMLSDEPKTIIQILNSYNIIRKEDDLLLLKKDLVDKFLPAEKISNETILWDRWIDVPVLENSIVRAKLLCKGNILNTLKSFFYKGEALYIDLKLNNGKEISYRIVESVATEGLWINPFIQNPFNNEVEPHAVKARVRCSNENLYEKHIDISWERIGFRENQQNKSADLLLFGKDSIPSRDLLKEITIDFEDGGKGTTDKICRSGRFSNFVQANGFSKGYEVSLDSIWAEGFSTLDMEAEVYYNSKEVKNCVLVASLENASSGDFWISRKLDILTDSWNYAFIRKTLLKSEQGKGILKIYVYNPNKKGDSVYIDDLKVRFFRRN